MEKIRVEINEQRITRGFNNFYCEIYVYLVDNDGKEHNVSNYTDYNINMYNHDIKEALHHTKTWKRLVSSEYFTLEQWKKIREKLNKIIKCLDEVDFNI